MISDSVSQVGGSCDQYSVVTILLLLFLVEQNIHSVETIAKD